MNMIGTLCVYAAICKHEGIPLKCHRSKEAWDNNYVALDVDLIAEQQIWVVVDPNARNEVFNCNNGDVFKWRHLWKVLADKFGIENYGFEGEKVSMVELMKDKGLVWDENIKEYGFLEFRNSEKSLIAWIDKMKAYKVVP
ncbi:3-oxo-Delta(4,5)-steroid 5-beta-reductase [Quercus suber]|uniref:3-oxo-Delta(4,5)-steroid 5-beta-reductase n=1 Tax=Quercus suber TaxID=58331 RepID=A0AAW0IK60_QUESU